MIDRCRRRGIAVGFVRMPESREFRAGSRAASSRAPIAISPTSRAATACRCRRSQLGADDDLFYYDRNHLRPEGATTFTVRFARESLGPLLDGTLAATVAAPQAGRRPPTLTATDSGRRPQPNVAAAGARPLHPARGS